MAKNEKNISKSYRFLQKVLKDFLFFSKIPNSLLSTPIYHQISDASILNQRVKKLTGFGLVLNQNKSHLVFSHQNQTKNKSLYFFNIKIKPKPKYLIFFSFKTEPNLIKFKVN